MAPSMGESYASVLLGAVLSEYERRPLEALALAVGHPERRELRPLNGERFDVEVIVDRTPSGAWRVAGRITDRRGGELRRAFRRSADGQVEYGS